jgi:hypothetical protein
MRKSNSRSMLISGPLISGDLASAEGFKEPAAESQPKALF